MISLATNCKHFPDQRPALPRPSAEWLRRPSAFAFVLAAFLSGCAIGPTYQKPEVQPPASFEEGGAEWRQAQPRDAEPKGKWWEGFRDPVLSDLVAQVEV